MFSQQTFYAPELAQDVTVRGLSAKGVYRVDKVRHDIHNEKARQMAMVLEHLRDGLVEPPIKDNEGLLDFASRYPELTIRLFAAIRHLTG